jgi:hypothetical protein
LHLYTATHLLVFVPKPDSSFPDPGDATLGAMMSALTSGRANRGDLRGGLCGSLVDKFGGALCVSGGGEHCSVVSSQDFQPGCDIGCVIFTRFQSKLQVGAQERCPEFGNQLLDRVPFATEAMPAEVAVEPGLAACPVGIMPISALCRAFLARRRGDEGAWSATNLESRAGELKMDWTKPPRCRRRYGF